jgi:hypothetical protein
VRTADLCREFAAAESGVEAVPEGTEAAREAGQLGYLHITVEGSRFVPDSDGVPAFITPVVALRGGGIEQIADRHGGETVDLVAWHPAHPERWALRTGVGRCLGYVAWWQAEKPTRVWRSPLAWLRARGDGIVLLTTDTEERHSILMQLRGGIVAEDRRHAAELRAICERPYPVPRIGVM